MELDATGLEKVLLFVCVANGAVSSEIGDIDECDESSIIAQVGPFFHPSIICTHYMYAA